MGAKRTVLWLAAVAIVVGAAVALTSCGGGGTTSAGAGPKIALLLPESKTARYETQDRPLFEAKVKALRGRHDEFHGNGWGRGQDSAPAAREQDGSLRDAGQASVRGKGQGALPRLPDPVQQRQSGRNAAAVAG